MHTTVLTSILSAASPQQARSLVAIPPGSATERQFSALVKEMWAPSTWRGRASVLSQYCRAHNTDPTDITPEKVVAFIMAKLHSRQISLQTAHTYLASLRALQRTFTADPMSLLSRALIRKGALIPEAQALPLSKPLLYQWLERLPIQLMVPVFLA